MFVPFLFFLYEKGKNINEEKHIFYYSFNS